MLEFDLGYKRFQAELELAIKSTLLGRVMTPQIIVLRLAVQACFTYRRLLLISSKLYHDCNHSQALSPSLVVSVMPNAVRDP
jgi:hypothetical protein